MELQAHRQASIEKQKADETCPAADAIAVQTSTSTAIVSDDAIPIEKRAGMKSREVAILQCTAFHL
jgi:hypothetical protein